MKNTVLVESKIRRKLKLTCTLLCVFCVMFIAFLLTVTSVGNKNLNGQVTEVTGELQKIYNDNVLAVADKEYNVVWNDDEVTVDFTEYKGKTITLTVTAQTALGSNPWILGLTVDDKIIVDYHETLEAKTAEYSEIKTVLIIVTVIVCVATCGIFIWRFNTQPLIERTLYQEFAEYLSQRQPNCPERNKFNIFIYVFCGVLLIFTVITAILTADAETFEEMTLAGKIMTIFTPTYVVIGLATIFALSLIWLRRREINFYADKLPFDFNDISHAPLRKNVKAELQQEIMKERELHPDTYADGGNGYDVTFGENGVTLTTPFDDEQTVTPDAKDIFTYAEETNTPDEVFGDIGSSVDKKTLGFSYKELNFEAVAHYRKYSRPMMIVIKSRLSRTDDFPEEFVNDIHIAFDINLLRTLQKYNVEVENLDYLLSNKKQLMLENCLKNRKKADKITK